MGGLLRRTAGEESGRAWWTGAKGGLVVRRGLFVIEIPEIVKEAPDNSSTALDDLVGTPEISLVNFLLLSEIFEQLL